MSIRDSFLLGVAADLGTYPISLLSSVVLARLLGPSDRGILALVLTLAGFAANATLCGMGDVTKIEAAKKQWTAARLHGQSVVFSLAAGVLFLSSYALLGSRFGSCLFGEAPLGLLLLAFLAVPLIIYGTMTDALLVGMNRIGTLNSFKLLRVTLDLLNTGTVLVALSGTLEHLVSGWLLTSLVANVMRFAYLHRTVGTDWSLRWPEVRAALAFGLKNHLALVPALVILQSDVFLINYLAGAAEVGYYAVATGLSMRLTLLLSNLIVSASPGITGGTPAGSSLLVCKVVRHLATAVLPLLVGLVLLAGLAVTVLYGPSFAPAAAPLVLLCVALLGHLIRDTVALYIQGQLKRPLLAAATNWIVMLLALVLYAVLIPRLGALGAALASVACYWTNAVVYVLMFRHFSRRSYRELLPLGREDLLGVTKPVLRTLERVGLRPFGRSVGPTSS